VEVRYYADGYIKTTYGQIKKLDFPNRLVILSTREKISADLIVSLETVE
jgi:hypothetical protein